MKNGVINSRKKVVRIFIIVFIVGLVLSGITAFPLETELSILNNIVSNLSPENPIRQWIHKVYIGLVDVNTKYPFMAYGTDWLAFAHIVIAVAFIGPLRDPVKNIWVIEFGIIACIMIFPLALIAGPIRGIPFYWRLIDCMFGAIGIVPLMIVHRLIKQIEAFKIK